MWTWNTVENGPPPRQMILVPDVVKRAGMLPHEARSSGKAPPASSNKAIRLLLIIKLFTSERLLL